MKELQDERERIVAVIVSLQRLAAGKGRKRRGRPPQWMQEAKEPKPRGPALESLGEGDGISVQMAPFQAILDGVAREVMFAGLAPGFGGAYQVNFRVPEVAPGDHRLQVSLAGILSNEATITVMP